MARFSETWVIFPDTDHDYNKVITYLQSYDVYLEQCVRRKSKGKNIILSLKLTASVVSVVAVVVADEVVVF